MALVMRDSRGRGESQSWSAREADQPRRSHRSYLKRSSRRLLRMTNTDENAIAAPAIIG